MKKITVLLIVVALFSVGNAQELQKSMNSIETGLIGFWLNNETRIAPKATLHSEVGYNTTLLIGAVYDEAKFVMIPSITLQPRYYYNLNKRAEKGKNTLHNSANYLGLKLQYNPNEPLISNDDFVVYSSLEILPSWGIKRAMGNHFSFETGVSFGYEYFFREQYGLSNQGNFTIGFRLRFGYILGSKK